MLVKLPGLPCLRAGGRGISLFRLRRNSSEMQRNPPKHEILRPGSGSPPFSHSSTGFRPWLSATAGKKLGVPIRDLRRPERCGFDHRLEAETPNHADDLINEVPRRPVLADVNVHLNLLIPKRLLAEPLAEAGTELLGKGDGLHRFFVDAVAERTEDLFLRNDPEVHRPVPDAPDGYGRHERHRVRGGRVRTHDDLVGITGIGAAVGPDLLKDAPHGERALGPAVKLCVPAHVQENSGCATKRACAGSSRSRAAASRPKR